MGRKIKKIPVVFIVALVAIGLWALTTFDEQNKILVRTSNETSQKESVEIAEENTENKKTIVSEIEPSPQPETKPADIPAPQDRVPGSTLSEKAIKDLGLEGVKEDEGVFFATATTPDDAIYPQWYTTIIDAPNAWDTSTGSATTLVAVIDSGYALDHEDLTDAWFINSGEQGMTQSGDTCWSGTPEDKQTNGCDDDGNTYADDWRGWDFAGNDNNVQTATNSATGSSHGTKSAGLVGGRGNNTVGVASVNWQTEILPLQALYDEGYGYSTDITAAIYYAVSMGADVINLSLGGPTPDSFTRAAVQYAEQNNVIVVASSGNCGDTQSSPDCIGYPSPGGMGYPARYPEAIAVGATTSSDAQASFSSWGDELDIVAPGSGTIQTPTWTSSNATNAYSATSYGTSFSSPIVAGAIATLKGEMPEITKSEILALFANSSDKVSGMNGNNWTKRFGWGRLNMFEMLNELSIYKIQLQKGAGQISEQSTSTKPQISSNAGHSNSSRIYSSTEVKTYCLTSPNTLCTLTLDKQGSSSQVVFPAKLTNSQGVAIFEWSRADVSSGTWDARVNANSLNSTKESLIVN